MAHLYTAYLCNFCSQIPESAPIYQCPNRHQYCHECFRKLQRLYRGHTDGGGCCTVCRYQGRFEKLEVDIELLKKLKTNPGIGRPFRYSFKKSLCFEGKELEDSEVKQPKYQGFLATRHKMTRASSAMAISRRPLTCLHDGCLKSIAVTSLVSHFRHDHGGVPCFSTEKMKDLTILFDLSLIEHDRTYCLAMVTVYQNNNIDVCRSRSSQSVINTCRKLSGRIPINTLWLMMSGSKDYRKNTAYVILWLYSNTSELSWCTIELSSKYGKISFSSFSQIIGLHESRTVEEVAKSMNCLYVSYGTFVALLSEGDSIYLSLKIH